MHNAYWSYIISMVLRYIVYLRRWVQPRTVSYDKSICFHTTPGAIGGREGKGTTTCSGRGTTTAVPGIRYSSIVHATKSWDCKQYHRHANVRTRMYDNDEDRLCARFGNIPWSRG